MLNLAITNQNLTKIRHDLSNKVLIICEKLESLSLLTEKCIDAGVKERDIYHHTSIFNIQDVISDNITHIIIDAHLYNYFAVTVLNQYIDENKLSILIYHSEEELKTIRLITDNRLSHINRMTTPLLLRKLLDE